MNASFAFATLATDTSSQNTCGASAITPAVRTPEPAATSAIDAPSLCPYSTASRTPITSSNPGSPTRPSSSM